MYKLFIVAIALSMSIATLGKDKKTPFEITPIATFNEPWSMTFLPDGKMLITEKSGALLLVSQDGKTSVSVQNVPEVDYRGQGGLGDIILHPDYANNGLVYISYAESGPDNTRGAVVACAKLEINENEPPALTQLKVIWTQYPKVTGAGHYGHRMAFDSKGYLFISSGERQKFDPSQDMNSNMGKIVRLHANGTVPLDNPFIQAGGVTAQIWSLGHRNPLGLAFDAQGRLWNSEMGPKHGDELNLVKRGENYGYPIVSNGDHYNGDPIPNHSTRPEFTAPEVYWVPTIAPAELIFYSGEEFKEWNGSFLIAGLRPQTIIRVAINDDTAQEVERFDMGKRIRELEQGPDGALWVLEDGKSARLLKLTRQ